MSARTTESSTAPASRVTFRGDKRVGGIAGENNKIIVNCATLGGAIRGSDLNGDGSVENCGGLVGGNTNKNAFVINCYGWGDSVTLEGGNNSGGLIGYGGSDSFAINCYTTTSVVSAGNSSIGAVGYIKKSNLQNIYGNAALAQVVGSSKNTGKQRTFRLADFDHRIADA